MAARRAAIAMALSVVGRYFATGLQPLTPQAALGHGDRSGRAEEGAPDALLDALRLRAGLAAARRIRLILERIASRATFRYELRPEESTGHVTGQLDVSRYLMRLGAVTDVPTYPVLTVRRTEHTPENVLAAYAARWILRELHTCVAAIRIPSTGPEHRRYQEERQALERVLRLPWLIACAPAAAQVRHRRAERDLLASVKRRLHRREIANTAPYAELVDWVERVLAGEPVVDSGDLEWDFYDDRFDTRLFELWCLRMLAVGISRQLVVPVPDLDPGWRIDRPAYTWHQYAGSIELYFQRSLPRVAPGRRARWRRDDGTSLGGVPDMVIRAVRPDEPASERFAVIDPKLRQRGGPPAEELYKVLGYLDNFGLSSSPLGAILFQTTDTEDLTGYIYRAFSPEGGGADHGSDASGDGKLYAVRLNPAAPDASHIALAPLVTTVLGMLDIPRLDQYANEQPTNDEGERFYRAKQAELQACAATIPPQLLNQSRHRVRMALGDTRWQTLGGQTQAMLATAEHIGFSLLAGSDARQGMVDDYSGPVIGVCASIESVLHDCVITPATSHDTALHEDCGRATLGNVIRIIEDSLNGISNPQPKHLAVLAHLNAAGIDKDAVRDLVQPLRRISQNFRNPAAHRHVLTQQTWSRLWQIAVSEDRILARVIDAVAPPPYTGGGEEDGTERPPLSG
ncbi:hypothetical protein [Streptomyces sp. ITFR-6]|uniref:hypothetical protein n=1 Tax=Streptomyces sp. ITFR-6 TaxID=3075197 RepID=UPI0028891990|nr:hypothetical protein [Streptomyces sp. ITFR-6]WNI30332.1 hypothetical protein RLT59_17155 [Streptomyces sp. ITFR-6]